MSIEYKRGHFILGAEFNDTNTYDMYPDVGTDSGVCKTITPMVNFNPALPTPKDQDEYKILLGRVTKSFTRVILMYNFLGVEMFKSFNTCLVGSLSIKKKKLQ